MKIEIKCPHCGKTYHVNKEHTEKNARCVCGHIFELLLNRKVETPQIYPLPPRLSSSVKVDVSETMNLHHIQQQRGRVKRVGSLRVRNMIKFLAPIASKSLLILIGLVICHIYIQSLFMTILVGVLLIGFIAIFHHFSAKGRAMLYQEMKETIKLSLCGITDFVPSHQHIIEYDGTSSFYEYSFIEIDESIMKIRIGGKSQTVYSRIIDIHQVLGVQISEDGKEISGSVLGMAAVGGILFGGSGAVVGAIAGQNASKKMVSDVSLKIAIDDLSTPIVGLNFMTSTHDRGGCLHKYALQEAQEWMGRINVLISRRDKKKMLER